MAVPAKVLPKAVQKNRQKGDKEALRAQGRAGAKASMVTRLINRFRHDRLLAEAAVHAAQNRAGFDDNYDPTDDGQVIWF